jgi:hypothetical protein
MKTQTTYRLPLVLAICCLSFLLTSCAALSPGYEKPVVTISSFRPLPSEGMLPAFEIGLRIINPNPSTLSLVGIVYTVSIQGHDLVKGVGKDFPVIEGYSEESVTLTASANLFAGIRLVSELMNQTNEGDGLSYEFKAKLDVAGPYPSIRVNESGEFQMDGRKTKELK